MSFHDRGFGRKNAGARPVDADATEFSEVLELLQARDAEIKSFAEKADAEIKATGKIATETKSALDKLSTDGVALAERLQAVEQKMSKRSFGPAAAKSVGEQFVESEDFKSLASKGAGSARISIKANELTSATTDTNGAVGDAIVPQRLPGVLQPAQREFTIRSLLLPGRTSSNAVEYIEETGYTNNAAVVAELGAVPQSHLKFDLKTVNVKNIAHHIVASRNVLSDVPMLQSYIDVRLRYGLAEKEESELLTDLLAAAIPFNELAYSEATDTPIDTIRRAVLQVRIAELKPTFVVLNPIDWADIELQKDDNGRYIEVSIREGGELRLWRLAVVESTVMTAGRFLVGATMAAQIFDREDAAVEVATQHADFRLNGKVAIIGEERLALTVTRPEAFVYGQFELGDEVDSINTVA
ncbi:MAG TPA: phage major capsid protein [Devosia sp.]|jgi:HK97 family phage major capsid protein|nr:phage major capsid protein [Devosia sp.]